MKIEPDELTLPLHCGHPAQVEWVAGDLWLVHPPLRLGGSVLAAEASLRKTRRRCPECSKRKRPARNPASRSGKQGRT